MAAAQRRVASFLGIPSTSAPATQELIVAEPPRPAVREACCADYKLTSEERRNVLLIFFLLYTIIYCI